LASPQNVLIFCGMEGILLYHRAPLRLKRKRLARGNVKLNA
jgi:hypothetical protein